MASHGIDPTLTLIPILSKWMYLVLAHFCVSVINNMTPGLNIAMPLHMIFRSVGVIKCNGNYVT